MLKPNQDEPYMNGRLYEGMVDVRASLGLTNIYIVEKPGVRSTGALAVPDGEPDVILLFAEFGANEPHAVIECKRVNPTENPKQLRGEYVRSGMDRFIRGRYGPGHELDFMVAYLLEGDTESGMADINAYLDNVDRSIDSLQESSNYSDFGCVAVSNHRRILHNDHICLLHSFLLFPVVRT